MDPDRVLAELRELAQLTSDDAGAQRVAFTPAWDAAREWLLGKLAELPVTVAEDSARNLWATLPGAVEPPLAIGSHVDSVPNGGWLDGALGVVAGLEVLRALGPSPARSVVLVDWADEEGRFGHSLLGSSAATGTLDVAALRAAGAGEVLDLDALVGASLPPLHAYLELHIEQGPVLERAGLALAAVSGTFGVRRSQLTFVGEPAHAGATPMDARRDPVLAAARFVVAAREAAVAAGGLVTVGSIAASPGTPTAVAAGCALSVDVRHSEREALEQLHASLLAIAVEAEVQPLWSIDPIAFDPALVAAVRAAAGGGEPIPSGPLHDAAAVARAGVPSAMLFVRSRGGISHSAAEDSSEDDIRAAVHALADAVRATL